MISMILCNHCVIPQRMYKPSVPLCDAIDYLRSTWLKLSSVSTVNFPETGGRTVDTASLPVTAQSQRFSNNPNCPSSAAKCQAVLRRCLFQQQLFLAPVLATVL